VRQHRLAATETPGTSFKAFGTTLIDGEGIIQLNPTPFATCWKRLAERSSPSYERGQLQ